MESEFDLDNLKKQNIQSLEDQEAELDELCEEELYLI
jgi:hypothetical protein